MYGRGRGMGSLWPFGSGVGKGRWPALLLVLCVLVLAHARGVATEQRQMIAGAGPSTGVVTEFARYLGETGAGSAYEFSVPAKSIKHAGGLKSTSKYLLGRTGRPLNAAEKAQGYEEIWLAKMPIAIVKGIGAGVDKITLDQMCGLFSGKVTNWKRVGGNDLDVVVFSREPTEALFLELKKDQPCMEQVAKTPFTFRKDHQVVDMLTKQDVGRQAIGFGALQNFPAENVLQVEGFRAGVNLGLVYAAEHRDDPLVLAAKALARGQLWHDKVAEMGLGSPDPQ